MHMLKSLVIGMGILIVISMAAIAYGIYYKSTNPDFALFSQPAGGETGGGGRNAPAKPFGELAVPLPEGCRIASIRPTRGRRLFLLIGPDGPCERVVVVDVAGGAVLGTIIPVTEGQ